MFIALLKLTIHWNVIVYIFKHHTLVKTFFTCLKRVFGGSNLLLGVILTSNYQKDILIGFGVPKSIHYDIISKSNHFIFSFEKILYKIYFFDPWDKNKMHKVLTPGFSCKVIPWKTNKTKKINLHINTLRNMFFVTDET